MRNEEYIQIRQHIAVNIHIIIRPYCVGGIYSEKELVYGAYSTFHFLSLEIPSQGHLQFILLFEMDPKHSLS